METAEALTALGLGATILIATWGYGWQKRKDRALSIELEKLRIYSTYLNATNEFFVSCLRRKSAGAEAARDAYFRTQSPAEELLVYVDARVAFEARRWIESIKAYRYATYDRDDLKESNLVEWREKRNKAKELAFSSRRSLVAMMRCDLKGGTLEEASRVVIAYHGEDTESLLDQEFDGFERKL